MQTTQPTSDLTPTWKIGDRVTIPVGRHRSNAVPLVGTVARTEFDTFSRPMVDVDLDGGGVAKVHACDVRAMTSAEADAAARERDDDERERDFRERLEADQAEAADMPALTTTLAISTDRLAERAARRSHKRRQRAALNQPAATQALGRMQLRFRLQGMAPVEPAPKPEPVAPEVIRFTPEVSLNGQVRWPLRQLQPGQILLVPPHNGRAGNALQSYVCNNCANYQRAHGLVFKARQQPDGSVAVQRAA